MIVLQLQQQSGSADWEVSLPSSAILEFRRSLLAWYSQNGRDLPWRHHPDPYAIWVSEIMLQQTQVKTVIPYYQRWLAQFPTIETLAAADLQQVLKAWQGLGYYARARNLHKASQEIIQRHNGIFPTHLSDVLALSGIGRTTAGGILSAAFNQPVAILDGNVKRVLARLVALPMPPTKATKPLWQLSESLLDPEQPRDFNQALMDLGATICTPHNPACNRCPWMSHCRAYNLNIQSTLPMRETSSPIPHKNIGVAVIWNEQKEILIDRRPQNGLLGGLWEFPGGKLEPGETVEECIKREIQEELGIEIEVGKHLITIDHTYTHFRVTLNVHHCRHLTGIPQPIESDEIRWVTLDEIDQFPFPKANVQIIDALRQA
ncbi:A/G-specific adenine glycosylase [Coleofasciculus sp. FACHB-T130]|uniref:A/G-specific adenine glycosylase n=1 Tax=Cyanophyceae TaxID=3028117 RepID=UPI0016856B79|nr:A/G-specific adenine glycosylase [Coleofasciculus sp. FACHB-T130]MBD1877940.1 A/G-specific adenine glycosylase [Coleofasciculus sp. FACHB-T130]